MTRWGSLALILVACGNSGGNTVDRDASPNPDQSIFGDGPIGDGPLTDGPLTDGPVFDAAPIDAPLIDAMVDAAGGIGEPPEMVGMTLLHNQVRASVQTQTPLPALTWSPALAATAAAWVATCTNVDGFASIHDHNPNRSQGHPYYVGENIYASGGTATPQGAVQLWASEQANFTYPSGCSGVCGHYTQIVWRTTLEVGCAVGNCPGIPYPNTIVCNYGPGGNSGGAPY